jgi:hypothetical protein
MLSLRSIFIAAAAFATIASAVPTTPSAADILGVPNAARGLSLLGGGGGHAGGSNVCGGVCGGGGRIGRLAGLNLGDSLLGGVLRPAGLPIKRDSTSPGDILKTLLEDVKVIVVQIGQLIFLIYFLFFFAFNS